jgi:5'(3')-deoxyribonucleotidase
MIDPASVAFDIDGVFADTMRLFVDIVREDFRRPELRYEDITSYSLEDCLDLDADTLAGAIAQIIDGSHRRPLAPMEGAPAVVARLSRMAGPVLFVTARPDKHFIEPWLHSVLPAGHNGIKVVATGDFDAKLEVLRRHAKAFFVEDRLETCFTLNAGGITPVVFRQPWNRQPHPFVEVDSWSQLAGLMDLS